LGLALACNWLWARTGSAIQSEPLYTLLCQLAILAAVAVARRPSAPGSTVIMLGALLAACLLTRYVAIGLALAILFDLALRQRWQRALASTVAAVFLVLPWLVWMALVGPTGQTHAGLLLQSYSTAAERGTRLLVFYAQRIPDQITGPFVEVATEFQSSPFVAIVANLWAALASALIVAGWARALGRSRRRLAGLIPLFTLAVLFLWPYAEAGRFLIPLIPCLLIGAVEGLTGLVIWLGRLSNARLPLRASRLRLQTATLVLAASLPYSGYMLVTGRARAQEAAQRDFDAACAWIAEHAGRPGPVLSRHPGEVFWQTGRLGLEVPSAERPGAVDAQAEAIARTIDAYRAAYLLIDEQRYVRAPRSPLARFIAEYPDRARKVWGRESERGSVAIYELRARGAGP
jgi:hypothetical protein